jgi:ribonuclease III
MSTLEVGKLQADLEDRLGYHFQNPELLSLALVHPSFRNEKLECVEDNQRLEFLGDAALALIVGEHLYRALPGRHEGVLTMLRARIVCGPTLARGGRALGLGVALRLGRGERHSGGAGRDSVLADAVEAILGAIYLDTGLAATRDVVERLFAEDLAAAVKLGSGSALEAPTLLRLTRNWKTALQQLVQAKGAPLPIYRLIEERGPAHARLFEVEVQAQIGDQALSGRGEGSTKKAAESAAAREIVSALAEQDLQVAGAVASISPPDEITGAHG